MPTTMHLISETYISLVQTASVFVRMKYKRLQQEIFLIHRAVGLFGPRRTRWI